MTTTTTLRSTSDGAIDSADGATGAASGMHTAVSLMTGARLAGAVTAGAMTMGASCGGDVVAHPTIALSVAAASVARGASAKECARGATRMRAHMPSRPCNIAYAIDSASVMRVRSCTSRSHASQ